MGRHRLRLLLLASALWAVAPSAPASAQWVNIIANDTGGIIPWSPENEERALPTAAQHCARFFKYARITSIRPWYGDYIAFACMFDPPDEPAITRGRSVVRSAG
jgi:hypothetical protein